MRSSLAAILNATKLAQIAKAATPHLGAIEPAGELRTATRGHLSIKDMLYTTLM